MLQLKSSDSVRTISLNRDEVLTVLKAVAAGIRAEHPDVLSIRLFGSMARGDHTGTSDIDVLIVLRGSVEDPLERIREFYRHFKLPVPVDLLVYSESQIENRLKLADPWFEAVWKESREL